MKTYPFFLPNKSLYDIRAHMGVSIEAHIITYFYIDNQYGIDPAKKDENDALPSFSEIETFHFPSFFPRHGLGGQLPVSGGQECLGRVDEPDGVQHPLLARREDRVLASVQAGAWQLGWSAAGL